MYILTRKWLYTLFIACSALGAYYVGYAALSVPRGGSLTGYILGFTGAGLLVFLMLLTARKKQYERAFGRLDVWMRAHTLIGILTALVVGMHAGFRVGGVLSGGLAIVFILTILSGIIGLFLYERFPGRIARMGGTTFRQTDIMDQMTALEKEIETAQSGHTDMFRVAAQRLFDTRRLPLSLNPVRLFSWKRRQNKPSSTPIPEEERQNFKEVEQLITRHQALVCQILYQRALSGWLRVHIPLSTALITLLIVHIIFQLYY
jgi:hypothetical protein